MQILVGLVIGLLFGAGLVVSGMANPAKILNFLDVFGTFDPSLAFVMGGAVITTFIGYKFVLARGRPVYGTVFHLPTKTDLDQPLIIGAAMFGVGWGLVGYCPGPALTALSFGASATVIFIVAMLAGMSAARFLAMRSAEPNKISSKA